MTHLSQSTPNRRDDDHVVVVLRGDARLGRRASEVGELLCKRRHVDARGPGAEVSRNVGGMGTGAEVVICEHGAAGRCWPLRIVMGRPTRFHVFFLPARGTL